MDAAGGDRVSSSSSSSSSSLGSDSPPAPDAARLLIPPWPAPADPDAEADVAAAAATLGGQIAVLAIGATFFTETGAGAAEAEAEADGSVKPPALLLCHGLSWWSFSLAAFAEALAARERAAGGMPRRIVNYDMLGRGLSAAPPCALSNPASALPEQALQLLDFLGIRRAVLVGFSMGGWVAARFCTLHPERCAGLVLWGPACVPIPDIAALSTRVFLSTPVFWAFGRRIFLYKLLTERAALDFGHPERHTALRDECVSRIEWMLRNKKGADWAVRASIAQMPTDWSCVEALAAVAVPAVIPVLLMWGELDKVVPPVLRTRFAELLPHTETLLMRDVGHSFVLEDLDGTVDAVFRFLEKSFPR